MGPVTLTALLLAGQPAVPVPGAPLPPGYLQPDAIDITKTLRPAPLDRKPGRPSQSQARYDADRRIFKATRKLVGTPRYAMATADVDYSVPAMLRDFSCAAGVMLTPSTTPKTTLLMVRAGRDTGGRAQDGKDGFKRLRPYQIDKGPICQPAAELVGSFDYPSGHATWGWTWGTILAEILPDRATAIEARAQAYGESRVICGVHNASAVDAGHATATDTLAVVRASPEYQSDFAAAKAELIALRSAGPAPDAAACAAEAALIAQHGY